MSAELGPPSGAEAVFPAFEDLVEASDYVLIAWANWALSRAKLAQALRLGLAAKRSSDPEAGRALAERAVATHRVSELQLKRAVG